MSCRQRPACGLLTQPPFLHLIPPLPTLSSVYLSYSHFRYSSFSSSMCDVIFHSSSSSSPPSPPPPPPTVSSPQLLLLSLPLRTPARSFVHSLRRLMGCCCHGNTVTNMLGAPSMRKDDSLQSVLPPTPRFSLFPFPFRALSKLKHTFFFMNELQKQTRPMRMKGVIQREHKPNID